MNSPARIPSPGRILCVEDEPDIQVITRLALESVGGFELTVCGSGDEALECAIAFQPDLILLDVMMPGMDGPTTLKALRNLPGMDTVPVIFMTAKTQHQEIETYLTKGALGVITKPFDPMQLAQQIRSIWNRRKAGSNAT